MLGLCGINLMPGTDVAKLGKSEIFLVTAKYSKGGEPYIIWQEEKPYICWPSVLQKVAYVMLKSLVEAGLPHRIYVSGVEHYHHSP